MENKILVISPHPDDDVIGMGGTIAKKIDEGFKVHVIYVTNGKGSAKTEPYTNLSEQDFVSAREQEAQLALQRLSTVPKMLSFQFLRLSSSDLKTNPSLFKTEIKQLLIKEPNYKEIYTPALNDRHPTHVVCSKLLMEVIAESDLTRQVFGYEVWSPIPFDVPNLVVVDISKYAKQKSYAIQAHQSQCAILPYDEGALGKNKYNAVFCLINTQKTMDYAELFVQL